MCCGPNQRIPYLFSFVLAKCFTQNFIHHRIRFVAYLPEDLTTLKKKLNNELIKKKVIDLQRVQTIEWKGGQIIKKMFDAFYKFPNLLPEDVRPTITQENRARVVCDYIAGMTDSYALKMYSRLFESKESRLFEI